jgi:FAD-dependent urate hydroxylase
MPKGMCLRSNWGASHIADSKKELTLDSFCSQNGGHFSKPLPLNGFVEYGEWFQRQAVPYLDRRTIQSIQQNSKRFNLQVLGGETFTARRVVIAAGIESFASTPLEFDGVPISMASHSSKHTDLSGFKGQRIAVIGGGQSALESAALCNEAGAEVEVIARQSMLNWVGMHPRLHHLGLISQLLYSKRDVGPAGISRLVAAPHLFKVFPRWFQDPVAYRAIRPAVAGWLRPRLSSIGLALGRSITSAKTCGGQLRLRLDDGSERLVDHAILATGFRVDVSRYQFLSTRLLEQLQMVNGYPILKRGLESSIDGLHFLGKPAARSFGPLLGFVSGTEFAANELVRFISGRNGKG